MEVSLHQEDDGRLMLAVGPVPAFELKVGVPLIEQLQEEIAFYEREKDVPYSNADPAATRLAEILRQFRASLRSR